MRSARIATESGSKQPVLREYQQGPVIKVERIGPPADVPHDRVAEYSPRERGRAGAGMDDRNGAGAGKQCQLTWMRDGVAERHVCRNDEQQSECGQDGSSLRRAGRLKFCHGQQSAGQQFPGAERRQKERFRGHGAHDRETSREREQDNSPITAKRCRPAHRDSAIIKSGKKR